MRYLSVIIGWPCCVMGLDSFLSFVAWARHWWRKTKYTIHWLQHDDLTKIRLIQLCSGRNPAGTFRDETLRRQRQGKRLPHSVANKHLVELWQRYNGTWQERRWIHSCKVTCPSSKSGYILKRLSLVQLEALTERLFFPSVKQFSQLPKFDQIIFQFIKILEAYEKSSE